MTSSAANSVSTLPTHDPRRLLPSLHVIVYDWDRATDAIVWGPNAAEVFGFDPAAAWPSGAAFADALESCDGPTRADLVAAQEREAGSGGVFGAQYRLRLGGFGTVLVDDTGRWLASGAGGAAKVHGTMRVRREPADAFPPPRDRDAFLAQIGADLAESKAAERPLTIFALALANLAELNDALGYEAADRLIETVTARLAATMRRRDRLVRYCGNRFALALRGCGVEEAGVAAERILRLASSEPVGTAGGPMAVRLAIGAASAPAHAFDASVLLRRAEASLGLAKRRMAPFIMHDARLFRQEARSRRDPVREGADILNGRRIVLALQPVVSAATREPAFHEALLRVQGADGEVRPAGEVIPALERAGLVHLADIRMLELVVEHLAAHPQARISLNVSPVTMERPDWLPALRAQLGARLDIASRLVVEVTETAAIREPGALRALLEATRAMGAAVAIDDFGAGYTSFRNLRSFPVDFVKIDGAFVQSLARSVDDRFFVRTLIQLAIISASRRWPNGSRTRRAPCSSPRGAPNTSRATIAGRPGSSAPRSREAAHSSPDGRPRVSVSSLSRISIIWRFSSAISSARCGSGGSPAGCSGRNGVHIRIASPKNAMLARTCSSMAWKAAGPKAFSICARSFCWSLVRLSMENSR